MRKKRISVISLRKTDSMVDNENPVKSRQERFDEVLPFIKEANDIKTDFICLPETFSTAGIIDSNDNLAENYKTGETYKFCQKNSKQYNINLITSILTKENNKIYNRAVIFSKSGEIVGAYDKVHSAPGEDFITEGNDFPVYEVDGIKIGMQICYDFNYPEGPRILALNGAEIIFWPTMWDGPVQHYVESVTRTRAMENYIYVASSSFVCYGDGSWKTHKSIGATMIVSWSGFVLSQTGTTPGLASSIIDFDEIKKLQTDKENYFRKRRQKNYHKIIE